MTLVHVLKSTTIITATRIISKGIKLKTKILENRVFWYNAIPHPIAKVKSHDKTSVYVTLDFVKITAYIIGRLTRIYLSTESNKTAMIVLLNPDTSAHTPKWTVSAARVITYRQYVAIGRKPFKIRLRSKNDEIDRKHFSGSFSIVVNRRRLVIAEETCKVISKGFVTTRHFNQLLAYGSTKRAVVLLSILNDDDSWKFVAQMGKIVQVK